MTPRTGPLHVGLILSSLRGGGIARTSLVLAGALAERGHRVDLLLLRPRGRYRQVPPGIRLYYLRGLRPSAELRPILGRRGATALWIDPLSVLGARRALRRAHPELEFRSGDAKDALGVARYARGARPMLLMAPMPRADVAAMLGAEMANVPAVVAVHSVLADGYGEFREIERRRGRALHRNAAAVVAVSRGAADQAIRSLDLDPGHVHAIHNGVPASEILRRSLEPVDHPWFAGEGPPVILTVGRASSAKDHPTLVEAFGRVRRRREARLAIMGRSSPAHRGTLRAVARSHGVERDLGFVDFDENPFRYMRRAAVFVLSSRWEGFSLALLEAMACGAAVVSTDAPFGPGEILEGGRWGALTPVGDADALARAIEDVLDGARVPEAALRRRAEAFDASRMTDRYETLLARVAAGAAA